MKHMNSTMKLKTTFVTLFVVLSLQIFAQVPDAPKPVRLVNDFANLYSPQERAELERFLVMVDDSTSNQICVVTVTDLGGMDPNQYATELGQKWGIGDAKKDNGIVVLIKPKTAESRGQVYIAVGYGLESVIPDGVAGEIRDQIMIPFFKKNDYYGGTFAAVDTIYKIAKGEFDVKRLKQNKNGKFIFIGLMLLIFIIVVISKKKGNGNDGNGGHTSYGGGALPWILMGSAMGGHSSGSGFGSGGGGFGGFGGGGFGGGGAGGSW